MVICNNVILSQILPLVQTKTSTYKVFKRSGHKITNNKYSSE